MKGKKGGNRARCSFLEHPDAGAHIQDGASALGGERREIVITERPIQGMMLLVDPLVFQRIFGKR
jgi:hypothetical protein